MFFLWYLYSAIFISRFIILFIIEILFCDPALSISLATKWLRILSVPPNHKICNHLVAKPIAYYCYYLFYLLLSFNSFYSCNFFIHISAFLLLLPFFFFFLLKFLLRWKIGSSRKEGYKKCCTKCGNFFKVPISSWRIVPCESIAEGKPAE